MLGASVPYTECVAPKRDCSSNGVNSSSKVKAVSRRTGSNNAGKEEWKDISPRGRTTTTTTTKKKTVPHTSQLKHTVQPTPQDNKARKTAAVRACVPIDAWCVPPSYHTRARAAQRKAINAIMFKQACHVGDKKNIGVHTFSALPDLDRGRGTFVHRAAPRRTVPRRHERDSPAKHRRSGACSPADRFDTLHARVFIPE